jgi:hypothetical protein
MSEAVGENSESLGKILLASAPVATYRRMLPTKRARTGASQGKSVNYRHAWRLQPFFSHLTLTSLDPLFFPDTSIGSSSCPLLYLRSRLSLPGHPPAPPKQGAWSPTGSPFTFLHIAPIAVAPHSAIWRAASPLRPHHLDPPRSLPTGTSPPYPLCLATSPLFSRPP